MQHVDAYTNAVLSQILISFQFAVVLQGTIMIYLPTYVPKTWWTILIAWAELFCIAVVFVPSFCARANMLI